MKYLDENGLLYVIQKIKTWLGDKVNKVDGKGLSTNDFTTEEKTKLSNLSNYDDTALSVRVTSLENAGYQTASQVTLAISSAIADIQGIEYQMVESLPSTGEVGVIYLVSNSGENPNIYDEYIYVNSKFEKIGTTDVDLSGYMKSEDVVAITNAEIDTICS